MVRNNFIFLKNINYNYIIEKEVDPVFDLFYDNFVFFKNFNKICYINKKVINIKKINSKKTCINVLYF
jgi:hypothetical protein